jgi:arylsulfatase A-like enzyme
MGASESWWPTRANAAGKPNVVVVLVDDVGFSDVGCFGSEIHTPVLDSLAAKGVRFTNFHSNPMCSPTRASLLTGLNCHNVGFGHVANSDPGFPGYWSELPENVSTIAEILKGEGYATLMCGKWHLARDADISAKGPNHSWPCQRGFDRFYGILDAFTNAHQPHYLVEDNHVVDVDRYPDGYYLTDDLTTKAIRLIKERKANDPSQPFFLYLPHPAPHAPLLAKDVDIAKYADTYRAGWDRMRADRFDRLKAGGLLPADTILPPRNTEPGAAVKPWDALSAEEQALYARYMAVFAGMVDCIDQNLGRLRDTLKEMGEWDDTIVLFLSDNGASREGEGAGTTSYYNDLAAVLSAIESPRPTDLARIDDIGSPRVMAHYPQGWAMMGNTPFRLYKTYAHAGGHQVPFVIHWPNGGLEAGAVRDQYQHVIDIVPTLLDLLGIAAPTARHGRATVPMQGRSFRPALESAEGPSTRDTQYYELAGHRAFMRDGWEAVTLHQPRTPFVNEEWELFNLSDDPTQAVNLAASEPARVKELVEGWHDEAVANQVYPLDEGSGYRWVVRAPYVEVFEKAVTLWPGTPTLEPWRSRRLIWMRSFDVDANITMRAGDRGVLVSHGDQGGGYMLFIDGDRPVFLYNDGRGTVSRLTGEVLAPGKRVVTVAVSADTPRVWNVRLLVDGIVQGSLEGLPTLFPIAPFEGIDVGLDRRSPVSWDLALAEGTFAYTGLLHNVRYTPGADGPMMPTKFIEMMRQIALQYE